MVSNIVMFNARLCGATPRRAVRDRTVNHGRQGHASLASDLKVATIQIPIEVLRQLNANLRENGLAAYQVPLWVQLHKIFTADRRTSFREILASIKTRPPVFFTLPALVRRCLRYRDRRLRRFPMQGPAGPTDAAALRSGFGRRGVQALAGGRRRPRGR
jgi:hypothetical protein